MEKKELEKIVGEEISEERMQTLHDITEYTQGRKDYYEIKRYYVKEDVKEDIKEATKHNLIDSKNYKICSDYPYN